MMGFRVARVFLDGWAPESKYRKFDGRVAWAMTKMSRVRWLVLMCCWSCSSQVGQAVGQEKPVAIHVDADVREGELRPVWSYFGYDEPNYTYGQNGKKLLGELRQLNAAPVYVRVHNLLTSGDGSASLKWGSTNAYTEDAAGNPVYDWKIVDRIFDTFQQTGVKPLVEIGFVPEALSTHPQPYRYTFPNGSVFT